MTNKTKTMIFAIGGPSVLLAGSLAGTIAIVAMQNKQSTNADQATIDKIESVINGKTYESMSALIADLKTNNIDLLNLKPQATDTQFVWDKDQNKVVLLNKDNTLYCAPKGYTLTETKSSLWKMVNAPTTNVLRATAENQIGVRIETFSGTSQYSQYLRNGQYTGTAETPLTFVAGLDVGNNTNLYLKHQIDSTLVGTQEEVCINTNASMLIVDSSSFEEIIHTGSLLDLTINSLQSGGSCTTTGTIVGDVTISDNVTGTFVAKPEATVNTIYVAAATTTVKVESKSVGTVVPTTDTAKAVINDIVKVDESIPTADKPDVVQETKTLPTSTDLSGYGTERSPFIITSKDDFAKVHEYSQPTTATGGKGFCHYIFESTNKEIDASDWEAEGHYGNFNGVFDGNGLVVNNLNRPLFNVVGTYLGGEAEHGTCKISNITLNCNIVLEDATAGVVRSLQDNAEFENVQVHGLISGSGFVGGMVCFGSGNVDPQFAPQTANWKFTKCHCDATVMVTTDGYASGFIAYDFNQNSSGAGNESTYEFIDSYFDGRMGATKQIYETGKNYAYFGGGPATLAIKVKTTYTDDFIQKLGYNPEGHLYAAPSEKKNGWFYIGVAPEVTEETPYFVYEGYRGDKADENRFKINKTVEDCPEKEQPFITTKKTPEEGGEITDISASLFIGPNKPDGSGNYVANYHTEVIPVPADDQIKTNEIKNFHIRINDSSAEKTGIHGVYFDVVDSSFGTTYGASYVLIVQYQTINGQKIPYWVSQFNIPHETTK